jgi:predicted DNA-binding transcriptional regulator AlpA
MEPMRTLKDVQAWLGSAPPGTFLAPAAVQEILASVAESEPQPVEGVPEPLTLTWRERLWLVPSETRIGVRDLCEAVGKPRSWVYRHTSAKAVEKNGYAMLPHRRLDGELTFRVGEIRAWIRDHEEVLHEGRTMSTDVERQGWRVRTNQDAA